MEARRPRYRQDGAAPPERGHPLANLTRPHELDRARARAGARPAPHPAPLPRTRADRRRHHLAGGARHRAGQLGPEQHRRRSRRSTRHRRRSSRRSRRCPRSVYDAVGVDSPANPVTAPQPSRQRHAPAVGGHRRRRAAQAGRLLLRRRVRALRGGRALAARRRPVALRDLHPARASCSRARRTAFANLSTFTFWQSSYSSKYVDPRVGRALQLVEPDGGALSRRCRSPTPGSAAASPATAGADTFALLDVANRWCSTAPASRRRCWPG